MNWTIYISWDGYKRHSDLVLTIQHCSYNAASENDWQQHPPSTRSPITTIMHSMSDITFFLDCLDRMDDFPVLISAPTNTKLLLASTGSASSPSLWSPSQDSPFESSRMTPAWNDEIISILIITPDRDRAISKNWSPFAVKL